MAPEIGTPIFSPTLVILYPIGIAVAADLELCLVILSHSFDFGGTYRQSAWAYMVFQAPANTPEYSGDGG